jgi:hypothetical protein
VLRECRILNIFSVGIFVAKVVTCHGYGYKPVFRHGYKPVSRIGFNSDTDADATQPGGTGSLESIIGLLKSLKSGPWRAGTTNLFLLGS